MMQASSHCSSGKGYIVSILIDLFVAVGKPSRLSLYHSNNRDTNRTFAYKFAFLLFQCDSEGEDDKVGRHALLV